MMNLQEIPHHCNQQLVAAAWLPYGTDVDGYKRIRLLPRSLSAAAPDNPRPYPPDWADMTRDERNAWFAEEARRYREAQKVSKPQAKHGGNGEAEPFETAEMRARAGYEPPGVVALPPPKLRVFNPADWQGKKAPERRWDVPGYTAHGTVALLYADGGTGKGYLDLQLAVARNLGREWIGLMPEPGRTMVLSTEDDIDEMWRRIEGMLPFYEAEMKDLGDILPVDLVGENSVLGLLSKGIIEPTPMYQALDELIADLKPGMVILDVLADMFSGEESSRPQVTQFVGLLKRLCRKHDCTILLAAQPSVSGMNTGSGTSGSTGWHKPCKDVF